MSCYLFSRSYAYFAMPMAEATPNPHAVYAGDPRNPVTIPIIAAIGIVTIIDLAKEYLLLIDNMLASRFVYLQANSILF